MEKAEGRYNLGLGFSKDKKARDCILIPFQAVALHPEA